MNRSVPMAPPATSSWTAWVCGWCRYMNASATWTRAAAAAAAIRSTSATVSASGFSQSTCLPASAARMAHSACRWFGSGM